MHDTVVVGALQVTFVDHSSQCRVLCSCADFLLTLYMCLPALACPLCVLQLH
jgi:hypothetical protein